MLDRWVNIFFVFTLVVVFITYGQVDEHLRILLAFVLAAALVSVAFILNWVTLDGAAASIIFGTIAYGIGDIVGAVIVLSFFITGSILSKGKVNSEGVLEKNFRRDGRQVWANGFWFSLWLFIWYLTQNQAFLIAAVASIAMATSDTWATEIGDSRLKAKTRLITTREKVSPGTDGGISFYGTLAVFMGVVFIALIFAFFQIEISYTAITTIIIAGFLGCLADSYLGARVQGKSVGMGALSFIGLKNFNINNNVVNWMAAGFASILGLIIILITGI